MFELTKEEMDKLGNLQEENKLDREREGTYIPVFGQTHEYAANLLKVKPKDFYTEAHLFVKGIIKTNLKLDLDMINLAYDTYNIESEALGMEIIYPEYGSPAVLYTKPLINHESDIDRLSLPDPYSAGRMPFVFEVNKIFQDTTGLPPGLRFTAPFSLAAIIRGYTNFINDILFHPEYAHKLLTVVTERVLIPWIHALQEESPDSTQIKGADAWASIPNINLPILEEFVIPYIQKLIDTFGDGIVVRNWWGESKLNNPQILLNHKLKVSPGVLFIQDPDLLYCKAELFYEFAHRKNATLVFGIGANFLNKATPNEIVERTKSYVNDAKKCKHFILYLSNLDYNTPTENIETLIKTAHSS